MLWCQPLCGFKSSPESALGMGSMFATWVGSEVDGVFVVVTYFFGVCQICRAILSVTFT